MGIMIYKGNKNKNLEFSTFFFWIEKLQTSIHIYLLPKKNDNALTGYFLVKMESSKRALDT